MTSSLNSFNSKSALDVEGRSLNYFSLQADGLKDFGVERLPYSIKVLLENLLRQEDGVKVTASDIEALARWADTPSAHGEAAGDDAREIAFTPARVLMQDLTGVPAVVDLAAMRDAIIALGGEAKRINPLVPVELVIDHSVILERTGTASSYDENVAIEYERNAERYTFLKWAQSSFQQFRVVPPGMGICHQVNLEHLAKVVFELEGVAYLDTVVGTDSHTTMVNGLGVLGWGVGGIEAEASMLGQPASMLIPPVVGLRLVGATREGVTATDVVLTITQLLRRQGVVGKFVEAYGPGVKSLSLETRATIGNMSPEYGATCTIFPIDQVTLDYLAFTGRPAAQLALVEAYAKAQGIWHHEHAPEPVYSETVELDLASVEPSLAGPKRPQDRVSLSGARGAFLDALGREPIEVRGVEAAELLRDGAVTVAAITSCTNTSNPAVLVAAGLVAKRAVERGLTVKPWVKTSLAPGSRVVTDYLERAQLIEPLDTLGFYLAGYGCTTCIGNTGPLLAGVSEAVNEHDLSVVSVLSGNRNFEGRIHPDVKQNYLASPPLVVAYALAGTIDIDLSSEPLGVDPEGTPVFLSDLWPTDADVAAAVRASITPEMFKTRYASAFGGDDRWQAVPTTNEETYRWDQKSTYVKLPPYFEGLTMEPGVVEDVLNARVLAKLGDSVTTDHISPAGNIRANGPAGRYLIDAGVSPQDFNSYGTRRGNHQVMMRGTFANIRLRNLMAPGTEGGVTIKLPEGTPMSIFDAAMAYADEGTPLVILGGKEYGSGSSRDWAAKGTKLLGVRAVLVESFERIHRSNLVGMGVLPLQFLPGESSATHELDGTEIFSITGLAPLNQGETVPRVTVNVARANGETDNFEVRLRIDTPTEAEYYRHGGVLNFVLRQLASA
ncbi:MAG TPA: aconitate hydratase AcnA [Acidimicrobiales bacterium]|jgi:aconitate hydratase|nr:aconitate hydratase AcnA [Acidimicrobiales bacterium]